MISNDMSMNPSNNHRTSEYDINYAGNWWQEYVTNLQPWDTCWQALHMAAQLEIGLKKLPVPVTDASTQFHEFRII